MKQIKKNEKGKRNGRREWEKRRSKKFWVGKEGMRKKAEDEQGIRALRLEQWSKIAGQNRSEGKASRLAGFT